MIILKKNRKVFSALLYLLITVFLIIVYFTNSLSASDEIFKNKRISINFRNLDLKEAVIIMADLADHNLICDQSVKGQLTVILDDILFKDAFQLIAESYDLDYTIQKNTIFVSGETIKEDQEKEMIVKNISFDYIDSEKAEKYFNDLYPELDLLNMDSEGLLFKAEKKKLAEIEMLADKLDRPQKQVLIQARLEEISRNRLKEIGIDADDLTSLNIIKDSSENIEKVKLSWPDRLKMFEEEGISEILANPSLITLDRKKAKLIIGDQIPVKLENVEDDKTVSSLSYIDAGIVLEFLPKIINQSQVLLEIKPSVNSIGQVVSDGLPAVNSRSAETTVILKEGEILALGGLIKEDEIRSLRALPFLSELPLLGNLFKSEEKKKLHTELMIFIKTKIINTELKEKENKKAGAADLKEKAEIEEVKSKKAADILKEESNIKKDSADNQNSDSNFIGLTEEELAEILNKES